MDSNVVISIQNCNRKLKKMGRTGRKVLAKIREKMRKKRMRCCKNYQQTGRIIQPQFVEIKPAKTCRKHRETVTYYCLITGKKQTELGKQAGMSEIGQNRLNNLCAIIFANMLINVTPICFTRENGSKPPRKKNQIFKFLELIVRYFYGKSSFHLILTVAAAGILWNIHVVAYILEKIFRNKFE